MISFILGQDKFPRQLSRSTTIFACLYYAYHFILVYIQGCVIYDSFVGYASESYHDNIIKFKERMSKHFNVPPEAYEIRNVAYPQQSPGENTCAIHVVNNMYRVLFKVSDKYVLFRWNLSEQWVPPDF